MNDRFFLDTNVFVYSFDQSSERKAELADRLIGDGLTDPERAQSATRLFRNF